jgi:hypothetical protein
MTSILPIHLVHATSEFARMDLAQQERLGDELHERQPNLLASVLVLRNMGASYAQLEIALHALFVTWLAMKHSGRSWPVVTEAVQETCLQRLSGRIRFIEGLKGKSVQRALQDQIDTHREQVLLAFVIGHLGDAGLLSIRTDAEKFIVLSVLNLVECVAEIADGAPAAGTRTANPTTSPPAGT